MRGFEHTAARSHHRLSGRPAAGWFAEDRWVGGAYFPRLFDSPSARVSAFVDFGNVYTGVDNFKANELRVSTGVALLWRAGRPDFDQLRLPLKKEDDEIERRHVRWPVLRNLFLRTDPPR